MGEDPSLRSVPRRVGIIEPVHTENLIQVETGVLELEHAGPCEPRGLNTKPCSSIQVALNELAPVESKSARSVIGKRQSRVPLWNVERVFTIDWPRLALKSRHDGIFGMRKRCPAKYEKDSKPRQVPLPSQIHSISLGKSETLAIQLSIRKSFANKEYGLLAGTSLWG